MKRKEGYVFFVLVTLENLRRELTDFVLFFLDIRSQFLYRLSRSVVKNLIHAFLNLTFVLLFVFNRYSIDVESIHRITSVKKPAFTCSNLTTETQAQVVKYVQSNSQDTRTIFNFEHISHLVLVLLLLTLNM